MSETWRTIPGFKGKYEVSDQGRVRSLDRWVFMRTKHGHSYVLWRLGRVLKPGRMKCNGHLSVVLGRAVGSKTVHSLVMLAFVGLPPAGLEIRHLNGHPQDNRLVNIAYGTRSENGVDKKHHRGQSTYRLTPSSAADVIARLRRGERGSDIARLHGIAQSTVSAIKHGKFHRDVAARLC